MVQYLRIMEYTYMQIFSVARLFRAVFPVSIIYLINNNYFQELTSFHNIHIMCWCIIKKLSHEIESVFEFCSISYNIIHESLCSLEKNSVIIQTSILVCVVRKSWFFFLGVRWRVWGSQCIGCKSIQMYRTESEYAKYFYVLLAM